MTIGAVAAAFVTVGASLAVQRAAGQSGADPLSGHWNLNVTRSHYSGGAEPRTSETFDCTRTGDTVACSIHSVFPGGRVVDAGFSATLDGLPGPTRGIADVDHVRLVAVDSSIADATFTGQGRPVFAYRVVKSDDGRSLTIISVDPASRAALNSVVVYDRRPDRERQGR